MQAEKWKFTGMWSTCKNVKSLNEIKKVKINKTAFLSKLS
jgi:hypothetical protein